MDGAEIDHSMTYVKGTTTMLVEQSEGREPPLPHFLQRTLGTQRTEIGRVPDATQENLPDLLTSFDHIARLRHDNDRPPLKIHRHGFRGFPRSVRRWIHRPDKHGTIVQNITLLDVIARNGFVPRIVQNILCLRSKGLPATGACFSRRIGIGLSLLPFDGPAEAIRYRHPNPRPLGLLLPLPPDRCSREGTEPWRPTPGNPVVLAFPRKRMP